MTTLKILSYGLFLIPLFSASGCFPYHFTMRPGAAGQVIDSASKRPIEGAKVTLTTYSAGNKDEDVSVKTRDDGSFIIPADRKWGIIIILGPFDPLPLNGQVSVRANGYQDGVRDIKITTMGPANSKLGIISLEQAPHQ